MVGVPASHVERWMFHVEPYLEKLSIHSGYAVEDVYQAIDAREMQLWAGEHYIVLTQIHVLPQFKALHLFFVAGDRIDVWEATALDLLVDFALSKGCERITAHGRDGWKSRMKRCGFENEQGIYFKVLT